MLQWDRDTSGRLQRINTQIEEGSEFSVHSDTMEHLPEEQQSQPGTPVNPAAYRSMRDHIHPPRVSVPSCIIPPAEDVAVRPYLVPLLPTYHGMENENPYTHIRDFEEVWTTFKEGMMDMDLLKLKAFPLTLKDKAKIWLNLLRPRTIRNWAELQAEFLKKFFSAHKTNNLKRQIYTFAAQDGERFYQCWERFMETITACPHHGFDTWMLVNHFYGCMSPAMKQLLETMCGGDFLSKHPDEAMDFLNYVAETSKGWDEPNPREIERLRPSVNQRGGMYALSEEMEMKARISTLARKVEELEGKRLHEVQAVTENPAQSNLCTNFQSPVHPAEQCPMAPSMKDLMLECANTVGQYKPQQSNAPYSNTYNSNWRNHPNLSWKPTPPAYVPPGAKPRFGSTSQPQPQPSSSPVEQAILNLSKVVGNFVEEQKGINVQLAQRIDTVENTLNKRIDGLESNLNQKIDNLQYSITKINKLLEVQERGRFPSQTLPNPKGIHEVGSSNNSGMDEVKAIITLGSGKEIDQPMPKSVEDSKQGEELQSEHILLKEDSIKYSIPPPFPQALRGKKKASQQVGILEVLRQVKVNIPLLDIIKQVPAYAKFLKDLCTIKKGLGIENKAFLTEQFSAIIQSKNPVKYKDPGSPTISVNIGGNCIDKSLLDLGASVNLLPYSVYKQLGLGELKPTNITLSLADRSVKIPKGIVEDVLVKIDKFYYPVDFVVLDTEPIANEPNHVPIILEIPFQAIANAIINCRNGVMQLTFGNMTLELNIFHLNNKHRLPEDENQIPDEVVSNGQHARKLSVQELQGIVSQGEEEVLVLPSTPTVRQLINSESITEDQVTNGKSNNMESAQATTGVEEIILLDPP